MARMPNKLSLGLVGGAEPARALQGRFPPQRGLTPPLVAPEAGLADMISQRVPSSAKAEPAQLNSEGVPLAHGQNDLHLGLEHLPLERAANKLRKLPDLAPILGRASGDNSVLRASSRHFQDNLRWIYEHMDPVVRDIAEHWYEGAHVHTRGIAEAHGIPHRAAAGMTARLSPGWDWNHNVELLHRILGTHLAQGMTEETPEGRPTEDMIRRIQGYAAAQTRENARRYYTELANELAQAPRYSELADPIARAMFIRARDESRSARVEGASHVPLIHPYGAVSGWAMKPNKRDIDTLKWQSLDNVGAALKILMDPSLPNISRILGEGNHKIRSFYNDIIAPFHRQGNVTVDTHQIAASHLIPLGIAHAYAEHGANAPEFSETGSYGLYALYQHATQMLAKELNISPRAAQSIVWEGGRALFPAASKRSKKAAEALGGEGAPKERIAYAPLVEAAWRESQNAERTREAIGQFALHDIRAHGGRIPPPEWLLPAA